MNYNELADKVEQIVCDHIGITTDMVFERTKKGVCVKARHLSIFILHTLYHVPIRWLSLRYNFSVRHIFKAVAQIRDYIKYSKSYSDLCHDIVANLPTM
jgi:hypothetical protein